MKYAVELPVRFGEIDHARVVYYPRFFHYFHQAFEMWFGEALGVPYSETVTTHNIGFPAVRVETEFRKPLCYGETARVEVELLRVGNRSITNRYTITRLPDGEISATATITTVCIDNDSFTSVDIPDEFRERFEKFRDDK